MMIDEYTADDLADDSEDERRIEKAERAAERKVGKRRKKRVAESATKQSRGASGRFAHVAVPSVAGQTFSQPQQLSQLHRRQAVSTGSSRPVGPWYFCGEMGHLRLYCPVRTSTEGKKWYPFLSNEDVDRFDDSSEVRCISVNCCTGAVNSPSKDSAKASANGGGDYVDPFDDGRWRGVCATLFETGDPQSSHHAANAGYPTERGSVLRVRCWGPVCGSRCERPSTTEPQFLEECSACSAHSSEGH